MAVAVVQEFKITNDDRTTTNYGHIVQRLDLDSAPPAGLIVQTAGWDEQAGVFRIVALWTSAEEAETFRRYHLGPILAEGPVKPVEREKPDLDSMYELHHFSARDLYAAHRSGRT